MIDALLYVAGLFTFALLCAVLLAAGIRLNKMWVFRRTRRFAEQQERQWLTEQQQRRQHMRAIRDTRGTRREDARAGSGRI